MNKVLLGVVLGAILGALDGGTAWFTPEVRPMMLQVIIGSTIKGVIAGVAAGWFAKKVNNLWAGIIFGLIVGLALAYWVAAMQDKYYFEIMLPGGTVGAILGFATQRYGKSGSTRTSAAAAMFALFFVGTNVQAGEPITAQQAFDKLKSLAGKWDGSIMTPDGPKAALEYRVTAVGSAVMETLFPGGAHEMITMYTVDGDNLIATHYCSGQQPTMRLDRKRSSDKELVFEFVSVKGTSLEGHIHDGVIKLLADDRIEATWNSLGTEPKKFYLKK